MISHNDFNNNFYMTKYPLQRGGAITVEHGNILVIGTASFINNSATAGGAIALVDTDAEFRDGSFTFISNAADHLGGAMYIGSFNIDYTTKTFRSSNFTFIAFNNSVESYRFESCGVLCLFATTTSSIENNMSIIIINNKGTSGGAVFIEKTQGFIFYNISAKDNLGGNLGILNSNAEVFGTNTFSGSAHDKNKAADILIFDSNVTFYGTNIFENSAAIYGAILINKSHTSFILNNVFQNNIGTLGSGGINSIQSTIIIRGYTLFYNNTGYNGGAVYSERGFLHLYDSVIINNNTAVKHGGGIFSLNTQIYMYEEVSLSFNSAISGGAMYLRLGATLILEWYMHLYTSHNTATKYGGAIFHEDSITIIQCMNISDIIHKHSTQASTIQKSFLQTNGRIADPDSCPTINSYYDFAKNEGNFLYGGLLDRSTLYDDQNQLPYDYFMTFCGVLISPNNTDNNLIASEPFQLASCNGDQTGFLTVISVYRGQTFRLHVVALGQGQSRVPTIVRALLSPSARLNLNQSSQSVTRHCSQLTYNLFSTTTTETLTIFPEGPCQTIGQASTLVNVTFRPCPDALVQSNERCVCEDRLAQYNATCVIEDGISILRNRGVTFWMNASYLANGSYGGLILYRSCPTEYCTTDQVNISIDEPDIQCAFNHSGVLCGRCADNYSLLLGGSKCGSCSNIYLLLILPFALAGIALVMLLSFLRLTVASGTINSIILYANMIQVNKRVFFPSNPINILTVFIAWVNLDFGFEICLFEGMDVYIQTWLQFIFSLYVWILISLIIITSRYSMTISKIIGSNPVAVLATLLLMSYNKILKVIIDVFSSVNLDYPNKRLVTVWLKDGNLPFMSSKHLYLSVFTLLVLVLVFLPYTFFLLLGPLLYRLPDRKCYRWLLINIKPLLDSYYAPYKKKTRYWTGFLLLLRCALYTVFSFNSLGGTKYSLLATNIVFSFVGSIVWLSKGIYQCFYIDVIEVSVYLNLIILSASAAILPEVYSIIVSYILVGIVFVTSLVIVTFQIHLQYTSKSTLWLSMKPKLLFFHKKSITTKDYFSMMSNTSEPTKPISKTVVCLREPLIESKCS